MQLCGLPCASQGVCHGLSVLQDLAKDRAPHYKKARRFFDSIAVQLVQQQHSLDVFACALDQARPLWLAMAAVSLCISREASLCFCCAQATQCRASAHRMCCADWKDSCTAVGCCPGRHQLWQISKSLAAHTSY